MAATITFRPTDEQGEFIDQMIESGDFANQVAGGNSQRFRAAQRCAAPKLITRQSAQPEPASAGVW